MIYSATLFIFVAWTAVITVCDCRSRRIPNSFVAAGLAAALTCAILRAGPFNISAGQALLGAGAGLVALLPFFALGAMGAADVKIFAVLGAWCGVSALPVLWLAASLLGGVHALWLLATKRFATRAQLALRGHGGSVSSIEGGDQSGNESGDRSVNESVNESGRPRGSQIRNHNSNENGGALQSGGKTGTPYVACLSMAAYACLALHIHNNLAR